MRKEIIDYKRLIHDHEEAHSLLLRNLNKQTRLTNIAIDCLYKKQYFEELRDKRPENEDQIAIVSKVKSRLLTELKALGQWLSCFLGDGFILFFGYHAFLFLRFKCLETQHFE